MKARPPVSIFSRGNILIVILLVACIVNSCKRDSKGTSPMPGDIAQAKTWYESSYPTSASANGSLVTQSINGNRDLTKIIKPDWLHATSYVSNNKNVMEIPVDLGSKFNSTVKFGNYAFNRTYSRSSYLLINDGKNYQAYILTIIADSAYVGNDLSKLSHNTYRKQDADFSGLALYYSPKGDYLGGYAYKNGQVVVPTTQQNGGQKIQSINNGNLKADKMVQVCKDWYQQVTVSYQDGSSITYPWEYMGTTCITIDDGSGSGSGGGGGTGGGGGAGGGGGSSPSPSTPPPPPCPAGSSSVTPITPPCIPPTSIIESIGNGKLKVDYMPLPGSSACSVNIPAVPCAEDPCEQGVLLSNNTNFINKMTTLNDSISKPHESAYKFNADGSSVFINGGVGGIGFSFTSTYFANSTGFIHNHENNPTNLSIFSADDFRTFFIAVSATSTNYQANYTFGLVTAKGTTYILAINDLVKFKAFTSALFSPGNPNQLNTFNTLYAVYINNSNTPAQNELGFTNLMTLLANGGSDPGLTLLKGNTTSFSGWVKVVNTNGTIQYVNCN